VLYQNQQSKGEFTEREIMYKVLFDMRRDINELKKMIIDFAGPDILNHMHQPGPSAFDQMYHEYHNAPAETGKAIVRQPNELDQDEPFSPSEVLEESLSLQQKEMDMIRRALEKYTGKRRNAARELGISERTLYRKIKEYGIKG